MNSKKSAYVAKASMIAALYVLMTFLSSLMGLSSGVIQLRLSEMLTVLPLYTTAAIPGLFIGCLVSNLITGCAIWDVVFGSIATLVAAIITSRMRRMKYLATLPPVIMNTIVVPPGLSIVYKVPDALWFIYLTVFIGEVLSCTVFGSLLITYIEKHRFKFFRFLL